MYIAFPPSAPQSLSAMACSKVRGRVQVLSNGTVQSNFEKFCLHRFEHCQIRSLQRTGSRRGRGSCRRRRAAWDRWALPLRLLQLFVVVVLSAGLWVCVDLCIWGLGLGFRVYGLGFTAMQAKACACMCSHTHTHTHMYTHTPSSPGAGDPLWVGA